MCSSETVLYSGKQGRVDRRESMGVRVASKPEIIYTSLSKGI